ncbi:uncharacterized protein LOC119167886 [Rhipicephalus microplus]|uniref:uncharacterized protein LOC119167886 n=1 Tax=Rhipicephalus microplus TaxID=6941 RepID=UPI003F6CCBA9
MRLRATSIYSRYKCVLGITYYLFCRQVALRKQQQVPFNAAAAAQPEFARDDAGMPTGASNIYRQRRYFPHYVESPQLQAGQEALAAPAVSIELKPIEAEESASDIGEGESSAKK